jgi:YD repeat-containing protein
MIRVMICFIVILLLVMLPYSVYASVDAGESTPAKIDPTKGYNIDANVGVNAFTGDVQVNYPLFTIPGRAGLNVPVSLSYSSNTYNPDLRPFAYKPHQERTYMLPPGSFGSGWSFTMGSIQCVPDGATPNDQSKAQDPCYRSTGSEQYQIHLLGGVSGKLSNTGGNNWVTQKYNYWQIESIPADIQEDPDMEGEIAAWIVTDTGGTKYYFDHMRYARNLPYTDIFGQEPNWLYPESHKYAYAWDLSRIEDINGNVIEIEYEDEAVRYTDYSYEFNKEYHYALAPDRVVDYRTDYIPGSRIKMITSPIGNYVQFTYEDEDVNLLTADFEEMDTVLWLNYDQYLGFGVLDGVGVPVSDWVVQAPFHQAAGNTVTVVDNGDTDNNYFYVHFADSPICNQYGCQVNLVTRVDDLKPATQYVFGCDVKYNHECGGPVLMEFRINDIHGSPDQPYPWLIPNPYDCSYDAESIVDQGVNNPMVDKIMAAIFDLNWEQHYVNGDWYHCGPHMASPGLLYNFYNIEYLQSPSQQRRDPNKLSLAYALTSGNSAGYRTGYSAANEWHRLESTVSTTHDTPGNPRDHGLFIEIFMGTMDYMPDPIDCSADVYIDSCYLREADPPESVSEISFHDLYGRTVARYGFEYDYLTGIPNQYEDDAHDGLKVLSAIKRKNPVQRSYFLPPMTFEYYTNPSQEWVSALKKVNLPNGGYREYIYEDKTTSDDTYGGRVSREIIYDSLSSETYEYEYDYSDAGMSLDTKNVVHQHVKVTDPRDHESDTYYYVSWVSDIAREGLIESSFTHQNVDNTGLLNTRVNDYLTYSVNGGAHARLLDSTTTIGSKVSVVENVEYDEGSGLSKKIIEYDFDGNPYRCIVRTYRNHPGGGYNIRGLLTSEEIREGNCDPNSVRAKTENIFDLSSQSESYSKLLAKSVQIDSSGEIMTENYLYDDFGNLIQVTDPLGRVTRFEYGPLEFGAYLEKTINPEGLVSQARYGFGSGLLTAFTDFSGMTTFYEYDRYGRLVKERIFADSLTGGNLDVCGNNLKEAGEECDGTDYGDCMEVVRNPDFPPNLPKWICQEASSPDACTANCRCEWDVHGYECP